MRSLVLIISLLFAFVSTQGQGAMFLRGSQPAPTPGAGLLDSYPGAAFAAAPDVLIYSNHSVTDNTVGSQTEGQTGQYTVLVRRDNDDALRSFTYTEVSDGTLTTWVGPANNGFVRILYDQSTNGNHATQTTAANQPKIVDAGSLVVENGKAALEFNGSSTRLNGASFTSVNFPVTLFCAYSVKVMTTFPYIVELQDVNARTSYAIFNSGGGHRLLINGNYILYGGVVATATQYLAYGLYSSTPAIARNGGSAITGTVTVTTSVLNQISLGSANNLTSGSFFNGHIQCLVIYPSDQSSNRTAIETAINTEYNIY